MRQEVRDALRKLYRFRCGYCGVRERDAGAELTVDHFHPVSQGGLHEPDNWVYCCHACNEFKGDHWQPASLHRILHPLRDNLASHLVEEENGTLKGQTETGTFHIERLHLNRGPLIAYRCEQRRLQTTRLVQARLLERLQEYEQQVRALIAELNELQIEDRDT
jgi:hypothetical protein